MYMKFFLIHRPDLIRTGYQNQAISSLEPGEVCEGPVASEYIKWECEGMKGCYFHVGGDKRVWRDWSQ